MHKYAALCSRVPKGNFTDPEVTGLSCIFEVQLLVIVLLSPKQTLALSLLLCILQNKADSTRQTHVVSADTSTQPFQVTMH